MVPRFGVGIRVGIGIDGITLREEGDPDTETDSDPEKDAYRGAPASSAPVAVVSQS